MTVAQRWPSAQAEATDRHPAILHVSQPGSEGVGNYVARVAELQSEAGHRVVVACPDGTELAGRLRRSGVDVRPWSASRHPDHGLVREITRLLDVIGAADPDVVHLHSSKAGLVGRLALRRRRPTVFQPHAWSFEALQPPLAGLAAGWERLAGPLADVVVAVSEDELSTGRALGIRARAGMLTTPNPVDTDRFTPVPSRPAETNQVRRSLGLVDAPLAVCVGRLCRQKGQDRLVDLWPSVLDQRPDATLLLVGDGPDRDRLEQRAGANVLLAGRRADVPSILRAAQLVVLPSRWEGMSLAVLEAMATARPVVATEVAGVGETVGLGAGAVVDQDDEAGLVDAIVTRLADPDQAEREGALGRRIVTSGHRFSVVIDGLLAAYRSAITAHPGHGQRPVALAPVPRADG